MSKTRNKQVEFSRRGAAAMARSTAGKSRVLSPNKRAYDRNDAPKISNLAIRPTNAAQFMDFLNDVWDDWA